VTSSEIRVKYYYSSWTNMIPLSEEERDELEAFAVGEEESEVHYDACGIGRGMGPRR
jgi:hypothetical protein